MNLALINSFVIISIDYRTSTHSKTKAIVTLKTVNKVYLTEAARANKMAYHSILMNHQQELIESTKILSFQIVPEIFFSFDNFTSI